jgi:amino acid transporter
MSLTTLLLGRRLANREALGRKIGTFEGLPAMGLDGLGSASYGPEAMLTILGGVGVAGLAAVQPITWVILALLAILFLSYWQTIAAYPSNGGCYTVARENLGETAGLLGAAALMVDYMLNVTVGISAGLGALTSAIPALHAYTLPLCLGVLVAITLVNLRGTRESGLALAVPTYLFIATLCAVLAAGAWAAWSGGGHPSPVIPPPKSSTATGAVTLWLVMQAFAAGCTAMTGVEAVSNGVGAFKEPTVKHAHRTLAAICGVLGLLLLGIAYLATRYGVMAMDQSAPNYQSVLSQLVAAVWGRGWLYFVTIGSVLAVLCLSANTSFVGFPRLCRNVAADGYLPKVFAIPGRRLVYTVGVLFLSAGAGALLIAFGGITDRLIPLFAVGAFLSFTLSQAGMAEHWRRRGRGSVDRDGRSSVDRDGRSSVDRDGRSSVDRDGRSSVDRARLCINGLGALATGAALVIILIAKFADGAWITIIAIPATLLLLKLTRRYYADLEHQVLEGSHRSLDLRDHAPSSVVMPLERWDRMAQGALHVATRLSPDIVALHLTDLAGPDAEQHETRLREKWTRFVERPARDAGLPAPRLQMEPSPYRSVLAPVLREVAAQRDRCPGRPIIVVPSELSGGHWWQAILHSRRTERLRMQIVRHGGPDVSVLIVGLQLEAPETERVLAEEEPQPAAV